MQWLVPSQSGSRAAVEWPGRESPDAGGLQSGREDPLGRGGGS